MEKTLNNSLSQHIGENRDDKYAKAIEQLDQIEDWLFDNPFTHPDFEKKVDERNNLLITINNYERTNK
ncbi:MAG: hypothetical protein VB066_01860 [Paludibacter sp.]|nr:hypothetical protein [Paludibacter sp.]